MTTTVSITGTGTPIQTPDRAGPGVLIRRGDVALQFDAGRNTVARLSTLDQDLTKLTALFVTHHHSDHLVGVPDLVTTRWLNDIKRQVHSPLPVYAPAGEAVRILEHMLDVWVDEMTMRRDHTGRPNLAEVDVRPFTANKTRSVEVARFGDMAVSVIAVNHEPVVPAVAYRINSPDGSVVITGDTSVCGQIEMISTDVDVLITEVIRADGLSGLVTDPDRLLDYHSECSEIGAMAQRARVKQVILTHMVPPPRTANEKAAFASDVRSGGYGGPLIVADDLSTVEVPPR